MQLDFLAAEIIVLLPANLASHLLAAATLPPYCLQELSLPMLLSVHLACLVKCLLSVPAVLCSPHCLFLQELSLPMWRRSLGGRAHPLAPALSAALGRLTQLTSLAVDGKFGHLRVVSCLTNLRRLASAAPLSVEGWEVGSDVRCLLCQLIHAVL